MIITRLGLGTGLDFVRYRSQIQPNHLLDFVFQTNFLLSSTGQEFSRFVHIPISNIFLAQSQSNFLLNLHLHQQGGLAGHVQLQTAVDLPDNLPHHPIFKIFH